MHLQDIRFNAIGDPLRRLMERVLCEMGIASRRLDVAVAEQLADHREALAQSQRLGSIGIPEVVNSPIFQPGAATDALPRPLKVVR